MKPESFLNPRHNVATLYERTAAAPALKPIMQQTFTSLPIPSEVLEALQVSRRDLKLTSIVGKGEANAGYLAERGAKRFIPRLQPGERLTS